MSFPRIYGEIVELLLHKALNTSLCRSILRKSGFRPGSAAGGTPEVPADTSAPLFPTGGKPGDLVRLRWPGAFGNNSTSYAWYWDTPRWLRVKRWRAWVASVDYFYPKTTPREADGGVATYTSLSAGASVQFPIAGNTSISGIGVPWTAQFPGMGQTPTVLHSLALRNAYYARGEGSHTANVVAGERAQEFLVWQDVPAGTHLYPYNVEWFVTRRELSARAGQFLKRYVKLTAQPIGSYDASLSIRVSTDLSSWAPIATIDLSSPGVGGVRGSWVEFNEALAGDVWLAFFLEARSDIESLNMGPVEALMRWERRSQEFPYEEFS